MEYTIINVNDNNTATVTMTINNNSLNQDIDLGANQADFTANIEKAMAVFNSELTRNVIAPAFTPQLDAPVTVSALPTIPKADAEPLAAAPTVEPEPPAVTPTVEDTAPPIEPAVPESA